HMSAPHQTTPVRLSPPLHDALPIYGHMPASRAALAKAAVLTARRPLGLYTLAHASREEVQELAEIAQDVPGGDSLGLEGAVAIAGALDEPPTGLYERERAGPRHPRAGAKNP